MLSTAGITPSSKVWIYQSARPFTEAEASEIKQKGEAFVRDWTAHDKELKAVFELRYNLFLVLAVDESHTMASGCSIDKSLNFIKQLEQQYGITLLDRMVFAYKTGSGVEACSRKRFEELVGSGVITDDTIVFNNLASTKQELDSSWEVPFGKSWHKQLAG